jgi:hypothetical protein
MFAWDGADCAMPQAGFDLKVVDHSFRLMFVFADYQVHVVRHDGTRIARVVMSANRIAECFGDPIDLGAIETDERKLQLWFRRSVEFADQLPMRLIAAPAVMRFPQFSDRRRVDDV